MIEAAACRETAPEANSGMVWRQPMETKIAKVFMLSRAQKPAVHP
jgi:hypothetical protein